MAPPVRRGSLKYLLRQLRGSYRKGSDQTLGSLLEFGKQVVGPDFRPFPDIEDKATLSKLAAIREEFIGQAGLSYIHACVVVFIRRGYKIDQYWKLFVDLWESECVELSRALSSRWLISALDTIVDMAPPDRAARAMSVVAMFNMMRFSESELRLLNASVSELEGEGGKTGGKHYLWDGVESYEFTSGDAAHNMIGRMRLILKDDIVLTVIFESLLSRAIAQDTLLGRISRRNVKIRIG